jgi:hypothetical protein
MNRGAGRPALGRVPGDDDGVAREPLLPAVTVHRVQEHADRADPAAPKDDALAGGLQVGVPTLQQIPRQPLRGGAPSRARRRKLGEVCEISDVPSLMAQSRAFAEHAPGPAFGEVSDPALRNAVEAQVAGGALGVGGESAQVPDVARVFPLPDAAGKEHFQVVAQVQQEGKAGVGDPAAVRIPEAFPPLLLVQVEDAADARTLDPDQRPSKVGE